MIRSTPTRFITLLAFALSAAIFAASPLHAQYAVPSYTIDSGGGTSTGGDFKLTGTIGQPDASPQVATGGNFTVSGGFWAANTNPYSGSYAAWAEANLPAGSDRSFDGDANQDGVPNGLVYIFGDEGAALLAKGVITAPPANLPGDIDLVLEASDDVLSWETILEFTSGVQTFIDPLLAIADGEITDSAGTGAVRRFYQFRATLIP